MRFYMAAGMNFFGEIFVFYFWKIGLAVRSDLRRHVPRDVTGCGVVEPRVANAGAPGRCN
jgi:hypothetical protein